MPSDQDRDGRGFWSKLQSEYSKAYRKLSAREKEALGPAHQRFNAFKRSPAGQRVYENYRSLFYGISVQDLNEAGPSTSDPADRSSSSPAKRPRFDESFNSDYFDDNFDFDLDNLDNFMADVQNSMPNAPAGTSVASEGGTNMEVDVGGGAGGSGAVGARASSSSGLSKIPPIIGLKNITMTFKKRWYKYTYGIAHTEIPSKKAVKRYCTPYAYYPVDWLPFYISPQEYRSLPLASRVVEVNCTIQFLGTRTAFDHGVSLSGTATTEYVPIAKYCIGMNNKLYLDNRSYKLKSTEPMTVESLNEKTLEEYANAMYNPVGAMEIPRHLNWYATLLHNEKSATHLNMKTYANYRMDMVLATAIVNKCMEKPIIYYTYNPKNGYIKPTKKALILDYQKEDGFADDIVSNKILYRHQLPTLLNISEAGGALTLSQNLGATSFDYSNQIQHSYFQNVEGYTFIHPHSGEHANFRNQPQVHVGLLATPALNPGTETTNFLNSSLYTVSNTECIVEFNMESMCVDSDCIEWPEDVKFFINKKRAYTGYGPQNYGITSTVEPRIESVHPDNYNTSKKNILHRYDKSTKKINESDKFGRNRIRERRTDRSRSPNKARYDSDQIRKRFESIDLRGREFPKISPKTNHTAEDYIPTEIIRSKSFSDNDMLSDGNSNSDEYEIVHPEE